MKKTFPKNKNSYLHEIDIFKINIFKPLNCVFGRNVIIFQHSTVDRISLYCMSHFTLHLNLGDRKEILQSEELVNLFHPLERLLSFHPWMRI